MQQVITGPEEQRYREFQQLALDRARGGETDALTGMLRQGLPVNLRDRRGNCCLPATTDTLRRPGCF